MWQIECSSWFPLTFSAILVNLNAILKRYSIIPIEKLMFKLTIYKWRDSGNEQLSNIRNYGWDEERSILKHII